MDKMYLKRWREARWFDGQREDVLKRDNYMCQMCYKGKDLNVHHRDGKGRGYMGKIDNSMSNLITLCKSCHRRLHSSKVNPTHIISVAKYWDETDSNIGKMLGLSKPTIRKIRKMVLTKIRNGAAQNA